MSNGRDKLVAYNAVVESAELLRQKADRAVDGARQADRDAYDSARFNLHAELAEIRDGEILATLDDEDQVDLRKRLSIPEGLASLVDLIEALKDLENRL